MSSTETIVPEKSGSRLSAEEVFVFLQNHPDFLAKHPELLEFLQPPKTAEEENVLDFQHFAIRHLQEKVQNVKEHFDQVITISRSNISTQMQVNDAVLALIKARTLEMLLEVLTVDFARIFAVDVVRLGLESDLTEAHGTYYPEEHYSGLVFVPRGAIAYDFAGGDIMLISEPEAPPEVVQQLFVDCAHLAASAVLLKLELRQTKCYGVLGFGSREEGRFDPKQATDMLHFLSRVFEELLDQCLTREDLEP